MDNKKIDMIINLLLNMIETEIKSIIKEREDLSITQKKEITEAIIDMLDMIRIVKWDN